MICKIFKFIMPTPHPACEEQGVVPVVDCQDWNIDEYGEATNCYIELHSGVPWDKYKLGRLYIGEENAVSERMIYGLKPEQDYDITVTLKALMTESIPFFTEEYNMIVTIGNDSENLEIVKIFSNEHEFIIGNFTLTSDSDGRIMIKMSTTSSNFQVDSISGACSI